MIRDVLSDAQIERYSRQILLQAVGGRGQEALLAARVAVLGRETAAAVTVRYLVAAGVGCVSTTAPDSAGPPANPDVTVRPVAAPASSEEFATLLPGHDAVVMIGPADAALASAHRACERLGQALLWGHSETSTAWATLLGPLPAHGCPACLREFLRGPQPSPPDLPVMQPVTAAWLGTVVATETIKHLLGLPPSLSGRVLRADLWAGSIDLASLPAPCHACGA